MEVKTHRYINREIIQQPENCENRDDPDLIFKPWNLYTLKITALSSHKLGILNNYIRMINERTNQPIILSIIIYVIYNIAMSFLHRVPASCIGACLSFTRVHQTIYFLDTSMTNPTTWNKIINISFVYIETSHNTGVTSNKIRFKNFMSLLK